MLPLRSFFLLLVLFHPGIERVLRFISGNSRCGSFVVLAVVFSLISVFTNFFMELKVPLRFHLFPQMGKTLIIDPQFKSVTILHNIARVLGDVEGILESSFHAIKFSLESNLTICLRISAHRQR